MRGHPECSIDAFAKETVAHAIIDTVHEVTSADMKCFARSVALGLAFIRAWLAADVRIDRDRVVLKGWQSFSFAPSRRRSFHFCGVDPIYVFAMKEPGGK